MKDNQQHSYYRTVYGRSNIIKMLMYRFFLDISSWPRLILEVFIRTNQGERYISLFHNTLVFLLLFFLPIYMDLKGRMFSRHLEIWDNYISVDPTWYAFLFAFAVFTLIRKWEIRRDPTVFNYERFTLSSGFTLPLFEKIGGGNHRRIETLLEPGFFFLIGLALWWSFELPLGMLLMVCSIIYSMSYQAAYAFGDDYVRDLIDDTICNGGVLRTMTNGIRSQDKSGFLFRGEVPQNAEVRRQLVGMMLSDDIVAKAV